MDDDNFNQVHLIKLKITGKNSNMVKVTCPFHQKISPTVQLKNKNTIYVPLINTLIVSNNFIENSKKKQIPVNVQPLLQHPFDRHNLKIQTYEDAQRTKKGELINLSLQFSLFLTEKKHRNYLNVYFRHASLKKDLNMFSKMNPYIVITNQQWKHQSNDVKGGHLNPRFQQQVDIPFNSVFDEVSIQIRDGVNRIGSKTMYIFEFFGKNDQRQMQLKKDFKIVGTMNYVVSQFEPEDF